MRWYFRPSLALPPKLLLFVWFIYAILFDTFYAYVHASGLFSLLFVTFPWVVAVMLVPLYLTFRVGASLAPIFFSIAPFVMLPTIWTEQSSYGRRWGMSIGVLIGFGVLDAVWNFGLGMIMGWLVDLHPCDAWLAGVTGSIPPPPSCGR